ncbi:MAG: hypothetical protein ABIG66_03205 [Candidatus Kerfeldbacteria bacterium]
MKLRRQQEPQPKTADIIGIPEAGESTKPYNIDTELTLDQLQQAYSFYRGYWKSDPVGMESPLNHAGFDLLQLKLPD